MANLDIMTLATRIIPTMLERRGQLVKGQRFGAWRVVGNALQAARIHAARGVDELLYLDIGATLERKLIDPKRVEQLTTGMFSPVTVGGGVRTVEDIQILLAAGADKVAMCSAALNTEGLVARAAGRYGSQAIAVAIDYRGNLVYGGCGTWSRNKTVKDYAQAIEGAGAGEIILTDIERDGTMEGYNLRVLERIAGAVRIPVIASGGCSGYQDMVDAVHAGASAVAAGALFQFTDATPAGAAEYLAEKGIETRRKP